MNGLFKGDESFNEDISAWEVWNVERMDEMFSGATSFNQDLSRWTVNSVRNMRAMFAGASVFNQDLSRWDVGDVEDLSRMFEGSAFNHDISRWNLSSVTEKLNLRGMLNTPSFRQDITGWHKTLNDVFFSRGCYRVKTYPAGSIECAHIMFFEIMMVYGATDQAVLEKLHDIHHGPYGKYAGTLGRP